MANHGTVKMEPITIVGSRADAEKEFALSCQEASSEIQTAYLKYRAWLLSVAISYSQAWTKHKAFADDVSKQFNLGFELLLQAVLVFLPAVAGTYMSITVKKLIGESLKDVPIGKWLIDFGPYAIDVGKEFGKATTKGIITAATGPSVKLQKFPLDPLTWQSSAELRVTMEIGWVSGELEGWIHAVRTNDPAFAIGDFDPAEQVRSMLQIPVSGSTKVALHDLVPVNSDMLQLDFQRAWFLAWIDNYLTEIYNSTGPLSWGMFQGTISSYGSRIGIPDVDQKMQRAWDASCWPAIAKAQAAQGGPRY